MLERNGHRDDATWPGAMLEAATGLRYVEQAPPRSVTDVVDCLWRSDVTGSADQRLRLVPDACVELTRSAEGDVVVFGPSSRWSDLVLAVGARFDGVRIRAGAARAVLGVDAHELAEEVVALTDLPKCRSFARVGDQQWPRALLAAAEERRHAYLDDPVAVVAPGRMSAATRSVQEIAAELGLSPRQFRRRFERSVGLTPGAYRRLARVHAALRTATAHPQRSLTIIAHDHHFADQAHFSREVLRLTGRSPTAVLRQGRSGRRS